MSMKNNSVDSEFNVPINKMPQITKGSDNKIRIRREDAIAFGNSLELKNLSPNLCQFPVTKSGGTQCQNHPEKVEIGGEIIEGFCKIHALQKYRETLSEIYHEISDKEADDVMAERMSKDPLGTMQDKLHTSAVVYEKPNLHWKNHPSETDVLHKDTVLPKKEKDMLQKEYMKIIRSKRKKSVSKATIEKKETFYGVDFNTDLQQKLIIKLKKKKDQKAIKAKIESIKKESASERTRILKELIKTTK